MKLIKLSLVIAVAILAICGISTTSYAFHAGGVAACESCHTMHNSLTGLAMTGTGSTTPGGTANPAASAKFLLRGNDQSSTCLNCHENSATGSYHISTPTANLVNSAPINYTPGGDFGWLRAATSTSATTERRGHNIVGVDFGYTADTTNVQAPGGTGYLASNLSCVSCHNPHNQLRRTDNTNTWYKPIVGQTIAPITSSGSYLTSAATSTQAVGPYRFLRGSGADQAPKSTGYVFNNQVPDALAPGTYNRSEAATDTHVAYGQGMSQWCGNCHGGMYDANGDSSLGNSGHPHPTNKLLTDGNEATMYNAYVGSGNLTGDGSTKGGYLSLVPVEISAATVDYAALVTAGNSPDHGVLPATAKVMCLSCHRAHATAFNSMTRFGIGDFNMTDSTGANYVVPPAGAGGLSTATQVLAAYYQRPATQFAANNKTLCNKCHAKD